MKIRSIYLNLVAVAISGFIVYFAFKNYTPAHPEIVGIASPLASIAGMLFGFICASAIFLASNTQNDLLTQLKATSLLDSLLIRIGSTGLFLAFSCLFMILAVFMPSSQTFINDYTCLLAGLFFLIYSILEFITCWNRIMQVVSNM